MKTFYFLPLNALEIQVGWFSTNEDKKFQKKSQFFKVSHLLRDKPPNSKTM